MSPLIIKDECMYSCYIAHIITPKEVLLNGLWFGVKKPKRAVIWVHGLGSSVFSKLDVIEKLADKKTAVISFNNRGHDKVSRIAHVGERKIGKTDIGGGAHEVFTDCVDDIQGAINFVRRAGVKNIYLAGHSTGCQKSIYWAGKKRGHGIKGIILLAPISDYSLAVRDLGMNKLLKVLKVARALVKRRRPNMPLPNVPWGIPCDAQRFLSLYSPDSAEEIFTYAQPKKVPRLLKSVKLPTLVVFASKDEFADRPAKKIADWFLRNTKANLQTLIIPRATHGFRGKEIQVASAIKKWIRTH